MLCSQCGAGLTGNVSECTYCGTVYNHKASPRRGGQKPDCPRCHQALVARSVANVQIAHCKRCAGLWIPHDRMHSLLALRKKKAHKFYKLNHADKKRRSFARDARPHSLQHDVAPARCPACHHSMRLEPVNRNGSIYLDICDDHGTWFDESELRALLDQQARESLRRTAGGRRKVVPRESRSGEWDEIGAAFLVYAIGDVVGDLFDLFD